MTRSLVGIRNADFVFAWIDCLDCFATLAEIGHASGYGFARSSEPTIVVAGPKEFSDLWFIYEMAERTTFAFSSPKAAFDDCFAVEKEAFRG
jgi:hypothetical protein